MLKLSITILSLAVVGLMAGEAVEKKSDAEILYEKAFAANAKEATKAYDAYESALAKANDKILKALESAKADLNDSKKGKLSIQDRSKAITELDAKIKAIKDGGLNAEIIAKNKANDDLLAASDKPVSAKPDPNSPIIGKWKSTTNGQHTLIISKDGTVVNDACWRANWKLKENSTYIITYTNFPKDMQDDVHVFEIKADGKTATDTGTSVTEYVLVPPAPKPSIK